MALGITVDFNANLAKFSGQMDKMATQLDKFQSKTESMTARVNNVLGGLGVGISAAGLAAFVKSGIDAADALNDMADRSGIAIEKLAGLEYAVKIGDTSMEAFVASSNKLSINISKNAEDFAKLGITAKDPVEAFKQLADVFSNIDDPQKRAALGAAALGKSYAEMAPLLMMGADGIQALIDKGRAHNPVTAEQARLAGEFNDNMQLLSDSMSHFNIIVSGSVIESLADMAEGFAFATQNAKGLMDVFDGGFWQRVASGSDAALVVNQLNDVNDSIRKQQIKFNAIKNESGVFSLVDDLLGYDATVEQRKLDTLYKQQDQLKNKLDALYSGKNDNPPPKKPKLTDGLGGGGDGGGGKSGPSDEQKQVEALQKSYASMVANLEREITLHGQNGAAAAMEYDLQIGALAELSDAQKLRLLNLAAEKDYIEQNGKQQQAMWDQLISDANEFVDVTKAIQDFASGDVSQSGFSSLLGRIKDDLDAGIISAEQAKQKFDELGKAFNDGFTEPAKAGVDEMSKFTDQAARNMQSAFADFLFDPFEQGMDGMLNGFLTTIRKMVAEAASAQIMESLMGKTGANGKTDFSSGLLGAAFNGIAGLFHDGGIVGSGGGSISVPMGVFAGAPRLHSGGYLKPDEVPAILQTGEMVLSRKQVAAMGSGGMGDVQVNTTVNVTGNGSNTDNMQKLGNLINARVREVITTEKRPGGLLA